MIKSLINRFFILLINGYRLVLSPFISPSCRFSPSCSEFAVAALEKHGVFRGGLFTIRRIIKCCPIGSHTGYDPVP